MAETIRISKKMKNIIKAFKELYSDIIWIQDLSDADTIICIMNEWTRQNLTSKEAEDILEG